MVTLTCFFSFSLASFFMPILFSKHLCVSAALFLPRHSWRSDRHGESVGQQPWNKYGWSWVRWARIICFAICLCECGCNDCLAQWALRLPGRRLTETHTSWAHKNTPCAIFTYTFIHACTHTIAPRNTTYTVPSHLFPLKGTVHSRAYTQSHIDTATQQWLPY